MATKYDVNAELEQFYNIYRTVCLNVKYWGCRADAVGNRDKALQIIAAVSSTIVLTVVLFNVGIDHWLKVALATIAAVSASVLPLWGLTESAKKFEKMHFVYGVLCSQMELLTVDIRRCGGMAETHCGMAYAMHQFYAQLAPMDETKPDRELIDRLVIEVKKAVPPNSLWMPDDYWA